MTGIPRSTYYNAMYINILHGHFVWKACKVCENRSHNYLQACNNLERCAVFCFARQDVATKPSDPRWLSS